MNFEQEILRVLTLAGSKGLKTEKIARHVYNSCNSIFSPLNYKDVHTYVAQYLTKNAKIPTSVIKKAEGHGVYYIDYATPKAQQLLLNFASHEEDKADSAPTAEVAKGEDLSLSLF